MTADVHIKAVEHRFNSFTALHRVDMQIKAGEFIVLLGPSGCGKTTLLSIIGGFLTPSEGQVLIGGRDLASLENAVEHLDKLRLSIKKIPFKFKDKTLPRFKVCLAATRFIHTLTLALALKRQAGDGQDTEILTLPAGGV